MDMKVNLKDRVDRLEKRIEILENLFEKKRRTDDDLISNLDESNFTEEFLKKILNTEA